MKSLFVTLFLVLSVQAFACPHLSGVYSDCRDTLLERSAIMDFTVSRKGNSTILSGTNREEVFLTDGRVRSTTYWSEGVRVRRLESASCAGGVLMSSIVKRGLGLQTTTKVFSTPELPLVIERTQNQTVTSRVECTIRQGN